MSKLLKVSLTLMLVLAMLFSVLGITVFAASEEAQPIPGADESLALDTDGGDTTKQELLDGWVNVEYTSDGILVTLTPDRQDLPSKDSVSVQQVIDLLITAAHEVVFDDMIEKIMGDYDGESGEVSVNVLRNTFDLFLEKQYGITDADRTTYIEFAEEALNGDDAVNALADYVCDLMEIAIIARVIDIDSFPAPAEFRGEISRIFLDYESNVINTAINENIDAYKAYKTDTTGRVEAPALLSIIDDFVDGYMIDYVADKYGISKELAEDYLAANPFTAADYEVFFASEAYNEYTIKHELANDTALIDASAMLLYGLTMDEIFARVDVIDGIVTAKYAEVYDDYAGRELGIEDYVKLLNHLNYIKIGDEMIYGTVSGKGQTFVVDSIRNLITSLPTFEDVAEMTDDQMQLSYDVTISTFIGDSTFNVTVKLGAEQENVRKIARIIAENVKISFNEGVLDLDVNVPDELAKAILKLAESDKISDSLKNKVFSMIEKNGDEIVALVNDVEFSTLIELLDKVDLTGVLDSKYVERFEKLDGLTVDEIKAKIAKYEHLYNKAIKALNKIYAYVPAELQSKTLDEIYLGDGSFAAGATKNVDILELISKANDKIDSEKLETVYDLVEGFLDKTSFGVTANVSVKFNEIYKISYYMGTELYTMGFLPVGADVTFFANVSEYNGQIIVGWVDEYGNPVEEMPAADTNVYAKVENIEASLTANGALSVNKIYDGENVVLAATVTPEYPAPYSYSYAWYLDGQLIDGANTATLNVKNVKDSGSYYCIITEYYNGNLIDDYATNSVEVTIEKATVKIQPNVTWQGSGFVYNGNAHNVTYTVADSIKTLVTVESEELLSAINAGDYTAKVTFKLTDSANYKFDGTAESTYDWNIAKAPLSWSDVHFKTPQDRVYNGTEQFVAFDDFVVSSDAALTVGIDAASELSATNAGTYSVVFTAALNDAANYEWVDNATVTKTWTVAKWAIDLSTLTWVNLEDGTNFNFIYNKTEQGVKVVGSIAAEVLDALVYTNNKTVNVLDGTQLAEVAIAPNKLSELEKNYAFTLNPDDTVKYPRACAWTISPEIIYVEDATVTDGDGHVFVEGETVEYTYAPGKLWSSLVVNATALTDEDIIVIVKIDRANRRSIVEVGPDTPMNAGTYKITLQFAHATDTYGNYEINDDAVVTEYTVVINPFEIHTNFGWNNPGGQVYTPGYQWSNLTFSQVDETYFFAPTLSGNTATLAGDNYVATATVELKDKENYVFVLADGTASASGIESYTCNWSIAKRVLAPNFAWAGGDGLVYDRNFHTVYFADGFDFDEQYGIAIDDLFDIVTAGDLEAKNAGTYTANATVSLKDTDNYEYSGETVFAYNWTIAKAQINASVSWGASTVVYNGRAHTFKANIRFAGANAAYAQKNDGAINGTNVGTYTVTASISLPDKNNYEFVIGGITTSDDQEFTHDFEIVKRDVDITVDFDGESSYVYDTTEKVIGVYYDNSLEGIAFNVTKTGTDRATVVGDYTYTLAFELLDTDNNNYIVNGVSVTDDQTFSWSFSITKKVIAVPDFVGFDNSVNSFVYDNSNKTFVFDGNGINNAYFKVTVTNNTAKVVNLDVDGNVIPYIATATVALKDTHNYILADGTTEIVKTAEWTINKRVIDISDYVWTDAAGNEWINPVYNGSKQSAPTLIATPDLSGYVLLRFTVTDASGKTVNANNIVNAGEYVSSVDFVFDQNNVTLVTDDGEGNALAQQFNWSITPASLLDYILASGITMGGRTDGNGSDVVTVDGLAKVVAVEGKLPAGVTVEYTATDYEGNPVPAAIKVGSYIITANFICTDTNYTETATMSAKLHIVPDGNSEYVTKDGTVWVKVTELLEFGHTLEAGNVNVEDFDADALAEAITRYINDGNDYDAALLYARDIYFMFEGNEVALGNKFTVRMTLPETVKAEKGEKLLIVYISDDGETIEVFETTDLGNNVVEFETEHFSIYGIVKATVADPETSGGIDIDSDESGLITATPLGFTVASWWWVWIIVAVLVIALIILIIILIKKRKNNGDDDDGDEPEIEPEPETEESAEEVKEEPVVEEPVEEVVVVEEPTEEIVVVEEPVEEVVVVEEPVEEIVVVEEPAPEEPQGPSYAAIFAASEGADAVRLVNGVVVPVRYRTSFMSRLIQSEPPIQDYYTAVKNYLLSFKGVKARTSWNFESFNKGRIQCAKLNVKGSAFQVYLGLDPKEYNEDKYHFVDVGDKPKLDKVPLMMKVKSDRSLKYTFELIDEVMSKNGIERGDIPEVDYHMPYESTEALVDKDLVKVILPDGMQIDENTIIEKVNVGELLKDIKPAETDEAKAPAVEEPVVEEPVVVHTPVQIVDHHVAEEQIAFVDATSADEIITDDEANELIEDVSREGTKPKSNKCYEINLDTICEVFEDGETVDLKALKARGVIAKKAERIKVLARGTMTKKVTVVADKFSIQAVKMIGLAGGLAQKYKD